MGNVRDLSRCAFLYDEKFQRAAQQYQIDLNVDAEVSAEAHVGGGGGAKGGPGGDAGKAPGGGPGTEKKPGTTCCTSILQPLCDSLIANLTVLDTITKDLSVPCNVGGAITCVASIMLSLNLKVSLELQMKLQQEKKESEDKPPEKQPESPDDTTQPAEATDGAQPTGSVQPNDKPHEPDDRQTKEDGTPDERESGIRAGGGGSVASAPLAPKAVVKNNSIICIRLALQFAWCPSQWYPFGNVRAHREGMNLYVEWILDDGGFLLSRRRFRRK